jgi:hypothetical protein
MYPFSGMTAAAGDVRFAAASLEVRSPGSYSLPGPPPSTTLCSVVLGGNTVRFETTGTQIQFVDYTPDGASAATQAGCLLTVKGNLYIGGNTKLWLRADITAAMYDSIRTDPLGNYNVKLNGTALRLDLRIINPGTATGFALPDFISASGTGRLTSPSPPFANKSLSGAAAGWSWDNNSPSADGTSVDGGIHK